ncbi:hypothetical protein RIF29_10580 [Crotalaria pallida]|uniref:Uncharacterized protein n=1 Tax=Crotalaria pallida TaxID=3830 RepID=A0AAN9FSU4_CROPI
MYGFVRTFFDSDKKATECLISMSNLLGRKKRVMQGLKLLHEEGMSKSNISLLFRMRAYVLHTNGLKEAFDEVKELGFDPSKVSFVVALVAKVSLSKTKWNAKVDAFKRWGWSEEAIDAAFRRYPFCMMTSIDKINLIMSFWVNQLGWNSLDLVIYPFVFGFSLEKRIIPRAFVIQYLLAKGLLKKHASLYTPFAISEKLFLEKYVKNFEEERSQLLKLYQGGKKKN